MDLIWWLIVGLASVIPMLKLLPHFGIHHYWALIAIIPLGALALLWWMAMKLQEMERR